MQTIKLKNHEIKLSAIKAYIVHLKKRKIGDAQEYENTRAKLHNAIFLSAGFRDSDKEFCGVHIPARVMAKDSPFGDAVDTLICYIRTCPRCHTSTDRNGFCWKCNSFITLKDNFTNLDKLKVNTDDQLRNW
jgi:hypothetical protein